MTDSNRPKIGLALGSGSSRGLAHIGILKALKENNIPIDYIAGTSIGAMIGGFYAVMDDVDKIERLALSTTWKQVLSVLFDPSFRQGFISGEKLEKFIDLHMDGKEFDDCKTPFVAVATDSQTGEVVTLNKGVLSKAVRASISIPLIFKPAKVDGRYLADGALSAPVPVEIVRSMGADIVIAVNLDKHYHNEEREPGWYDVANDSLNILCHHLALLNTKDADIAIEMDLGKEQWYKFTNGQDRIITGEKAMMEKLPQLQELMLEKNKAWWRKIMRVLKRR